MSGKILVIDSVTSLASHIADVLNARSATADPVPVVTLPIADIHLKREEPFPEISLRPLREPKVRDWEQRQRRRGKRRR